MTADSLDLGHSASAPAFCQHLAGLRALPEHVRFIAGAVQKRDLVEQRQVLGTVEAALDRPVDVAAACGRPTPEAAQLVVQRSVELANS